MRMEQSHCYACSLAPGRRALILRRQVTIYSGLIAVTKNELCPVVLSARFLSTVSI